MTRFINVNGEWVVDLADYEPGTNELIDYILEKDANKTDSEKVKEFLTGLTCEEVPA